MVDGVAIKRHSILAGIGGIAGIAALWRCRKSHTLYIVLPKVHLGKRQNRISRKPVRAKRVFHPRTLGDLKVKGIVKCFALCFLLVGGTSVTCVTFDFQEEDV